MNQGRPGHVDRVRALFDDKAEGWSGKYTGHFRFRIDLFVTELLQRIAPGSRVLDFGCGTGVYLERLAQAGMHAVGIDLSAAMVAEAQARCSSSIPPVTLHCGTLPETLPLLGTFRAIMASSVFEYLLDPADHLEMLRDLLDPGGFLLLTVPNAESQRKRWEARMKTWRPLWRALTWHPRVRGFARYLDLSRNHYRPDEFVALAEAAKLRVDQWTYFNPLTGHCSQADRHGGEMLFFVLQHATPAPDTSRVRSS